MSRPRFVERGGELVLAHPIACNSTTLYAWLVDADLAALTRTCERAFGEPSGGAVVVRPVAPVVAVIAADIRRGHATEPPDRDKGCAAERDLGYKPLVPIREGLAQTVAWYVEQHQQRQAAAKTPSRC